MKSNGDGVVLLALGQILVWAGAYYVFPAMLIHWEDNLQWARIDLTAAFTLAILMSAICSPFAGQIIDRGHGAKMMCLSAIAAGVLLIALSRSDHLSWFYVCWALIGITFSGCLYEPCFALITKARGNDAKGFILRVSLIAGFASTLSFPGVHFLNTTFGWRTTLVMFGFILISLAAPMLYRGAKQMEAVSTQIPPVAGEPTKSYEFLSNPVFWMTGFAFAWIALLHGMTLHHLLPLLRENGVVATTAVTAAAFIGPMQVLGRVLMVSTDQIVSNHRMMLGCFTGLGVSILFLTRSGTAVSMLVMFVLVFGSAYGMVSVLRPVIARELLGGKNYGAKSGILASLYLLMSALAPYLGAILWQKGGYDLVLTITCLLAIIAMAFYFTATQLVKQSIP